MAAKTHRAHSQDWKQRPDWDGGGLEYIGPQSGWYMAPKWSESTNFGGEDEGEAVKGIYIIRAVDSGRVKIGWSTNVYRRLDTLKGHSPERLELVGVIDQPRAMEKEIHDHFSDFRLHGEWFDGDVIEAIQEMYKPS